MNALLGLRRWFGPAPADAGAAATAGATTTPRRVARAAPAPDLRARRFMAFAVACAQAANLPSLQTPVLIAGALALLLAFAIPAPPRRFVWRGLLLLATVGAGVLVFSQYGKLFARDAGIALLFVFGPLKLLEAKSSRDFMVVWGLGLMLYVTSFFENLGLLAALSLPLVIVVYVTALRLLDAPADRAARNNSLWQHSIGASAHIALGIPLAAMLFVLFPRATAPLWGTLEAPAAKSGLSDEMRPGQIAELILSRETAFRVEFGHRRPPPTALYWRGPVLREFDGQAWSTGMDVAARMRGEFVAYTPDEHAREALEYTVTVERQDTRWLPVLELPIAFPAGLAVEATTFLSDAQQIGVRRAPGSAVQYRAQSFARSRYSAPEPAADSSELRTGPRNWNPRARAFAAALAAAQPVPRDRVAALLQHFNGEKFFYTLRPPRYGDSRGNTAIDEFLFDGRRGFCEHYAGATVFLLRASGIPARVVTGYLGGEYHPSGHLIVRQSDAHAWVEAWLDGQWTRIDPTAAVAPDRVERGLQEALPETERLLVAGRRWSTFAALGNVWEDANFAYTKWVIGFDRDRQRELLRDIGLGGMSPFVALGWMLLALTLSGALMGAAWWLWRQRREQQLDPWLRAWRRLRQRLIRAGLPLAANHTVSTAMALAGERWPQHAHTFAAFADGYNAARFARPRAVGPDRDGDPNSALRALPVGWRLRRLRRV